MKRLRLHAFLSLLVSLYFMVVFAPAAIAENTVELTSPAYRIAPGDLVRISVYQIPDLTLESRVEDNGSVSYPLLGEVRLGGLSTADGERLIAERLKAGGYVATPNVTIAVLQIRGYQVTVLGHVGKPGRFPLESSHTRLSDILAIAGGTAPTSAEVVVLTGSRAGAKFHHEYQVRNLASGRDDDNPELQSGDLVYVPAASVFYIYGEVQKPGSFRLEPGMSVMQALATGGGLTPKGTQRGMTIHRRTADHGVQVLEPRLDDTIQPDDVLYIREGLF